MSEDSLVSEKEHVQMVAREIWHVTGYRFTVKDNKKLKCGHRTRFWCSQDEAHKKWKSSTDPNIKNCENPGMKQFPCHSKLGISCCNVDGDGSMLITIRDNLEWLTPTAMVTKIQAAFHNVTRFQIHTAWSKMIEVPDGVEMLSWGMKKIIKPLDGKVVEIGVDATYQITQTRSILSYRV
ncbi:hypothetical protein BU17DRAFT_61055 [Hysterangium stoloniferum]|nr:hypothetical protein BU17DRAFT_61055 [Hysterangium stoloniferum]